jgi:hypothetical protein
VDQQQGGRARLAVLHDAHVTIVKPHEPVASTRVAGHVLCHCAAFCHLLRRGSIAASLASLAAMTAGALQQTCGTAPPPVAWIGPGQLGYIRPDLGVDLLLLIDPAGRLAAAMQRYTGPDGLDHRLEDELVAACGHGGDLDILRSLGRTRPDPVRHRRRLRLPVALQRHVPPDLRTVSERPAQLPRPDRS